MDNISSERLIVLDRHECIKLDEWTTEDGVFLLGRCLEDKTFYYVSINREVFEYDHMPTRSEIESDYMDVLSKREIDRYEEELHERIYGPADRLAIEREVRAEMRAEELFKEIMKGMAEATLREMGSIEEDTSYMSHSYDRVATEQDFEHMRDYGHTWGPGFEEPKPTKEEELDSFTKSNMEKNKKLLAYIEKALLNNVPESRIRRIIDYDPCGDLVFSADEIKDRIEKSVARAEKEENWMPLKNGTVTLRDDNGTWLYLEEKYQTRYFNANGYAYDVYWGSVGAIVQVILKSEGKEKYYTSADFSEKYNNMEAELAHMDDYTWNKTADNPVECSEQSLKLMGKFMLADIEKEIADRGEAGLKEGCHTGSNPKLHDYSTKDLITAASIIRKEKELMGSEKLFSFPLHDKSDNIKVEGHVGKWYVIDSTTMDGKNLFLLEHETYGDEAACLIVDENANVLLDEVWNGFDDYEDYLAGCELDRMEKCKNALLEAGYSYDDINSYDGYLRFDSENGPMTFETWKAAEEWLDGVVFDDPEVATAVEAIMHPERYAKKKSL